MTKNTIKDVPKNAIKRSTRIITEVLNAGTHGIGGIIAIIGMVLLILKGIATQSISSIIAYVIYGSSLIIMFMNSTLYHSFKFTKVAKIFRRLDHTSIYLLIAGTYTPYLIISMTQPWGYIFLAVIWLIAIVGIVLKIGWIDRFPKLSMCLYLCMGWLSLILIYPLYKNIPLPGLILLAVGGLAYSVGTLFYRLKHNPWMHIIWHLFVMIGAGFMYTSIYLYV